MKRQFETLDALRGMAALCVAAYHGQWIPLRSSYLGVDLFFVLSGFVLAHAYDGRELGLAAFMRVRLIRLWPLYLCGLVLGVLQALAVLRFGQPAFSIRDVLSGAAFNAVYAPSPFPGPSAGALFPLNSPAWSLFFELVINVAFCTAIFRGARRIALLMAVAAAGLLIAALSGAEPAGGSMWSNAHLGLARVSWSFGAGVLLRRYAPLVSLPVWCGPALLVSTAALLAASAGNLQSAYALAFMFAIGPAVVWIGASTPTPRRLRGAYLAAGAASYAVYAIHHPLLGVAEATATRLGTTGFAVDLGALAVIVGLALALERWMDRPVRAWLANRAWPARRSSRSPAPQTAG